MIGATEPTESRHRFLEPCRTRLAPQEGESTVEGSEREVPNELASVVFVDDDQIACGGRLGQVLRHDATPFPISDRIFVTASGTLSFFKSSNQARNSTGPSSPATARAIAASSGLSAAWIAMK